MVQLQRGPPTGARLSPAVWPRYGEVGGLALMGQHLQGVVPLRVSFRGSRATGGGSPVVSWILFPGHMAGLETFESHF